jgi:hypothetical protein
MPGVPQLDSQNHPATITAAIINDGDESDFIVYKQH